MSDNQIQAPALTLVRAGVTVTRNGPWVTFPLPRVQESLTREGIINPSVMAPRFGLSFVPGVIYKVSTGLLFPTAPPTYLCEPTPAAYHKSGLRVTFTEVIDDELIVYFEVFRPLDYDLSAKYLAVYWPDALRVVTGPQRDGAHAFAPAAHHNREFREGPAPSVAKPDAAIEAKATAWLNAPVQVTETKPADTGASTITV